MPAFTFNIAKGRIVELYNRVESNDPANCAFIIVPIEAAGLETDAVLKDKDTLADLLSGTTNEQTTMGRKTLTDAELAALPAPDDVNDKRTLPMPSVTWAAATGNEIAKVAVCYDPDTTAGTDANIVPLTLFDLSFTPSGIDLVLTGADFFEAT